MKSKKSYTLSIILGVILAISLIWGYTAYSVLTEYEEEYLVIADYYILYEDYFTASLQSELDRGYFNALTIEYDDGGAIYESNYQHYYDSYVDSMEENIETAEDIIKFLENNPFEFSEISNDDLIEGFEEDIEFLQDERDNMRDSLDYFKDS